MHCWGRSFHVLSVSLHIVCKASLSPPPKPTCFGQPDLDDSFGSMPFVNFPYCSNRVRTAQWRHLKLILEKPAKFQYLMAMSVVTTDMKFWRVFDFLSRSLRPYFKCCASILLKESQTGKILGPISIAIDNYGFCDCWWISLLAVCNSSLNAPFVAFIRQSLYIIAAEKLYVVLILWLSHNNISLRTRFFFDTCKPFQIYCKLMMLYCLPW